MREYLKGDANTTFLSLYGLAFLFIVELKKEKNENNPTPLLPPHFLRRARRAIPLLLLRLRRRRPPGGARPVSRSIRFGSFRGSGFDLNQLLF